MFDALTLRDLRTQMEQHLLMVEEVLGGLDLAVQGLDVRLSRIETGLGLEPEGTSASGWLADLARVKAAVGKLRSQIPSSSDD